MSTSGLVGSLIAHRTFAAPLAPLAARARLSQRQAGAR